MGCRGQACDPCLASTPVGVKAVSNHVHPAASSRCRYAAISVNLTFAGQAKYNTEMSAMGSRYPGRNSTKLQPCTEGGGTWGDAQPLAEA